jgi:hypothetical protein
MQRLISEFEARPALRVALLLVVAFAVALIVIPGPVWSALILKAARYFGLYFVILIVAGAIGWIAYDRRVFFWTAGVAIVCLGSFHLFGLYAQNYYAERDKAVQSKVLSKGWSSLDDIAPTTRPDWAPGVRR